MALPYGEYLKTEELLSIQKPWSDPPEHDELLFIVIHQTYELWFKTLLHEFEKIKRDFESEDLYGLIHSFKRCRTIMKTLVGQVDILETMTPFSFSSFRDRLATASGFQSLQFREIEFELGFKRKKVLEHYTSHPEFVAVLEEKLPKPSIPDYFYRFLSKTGLNVPKELLERDMTEPVSESEELQKELLTLYKERPNYSILLELMTDLDEGFQEWRYRHVKLAERSIGAKKGTGGSLGVKFLKRSLFQPVFPDLWGVRDLF